MKANTHPQNSENNWFPTAENPEYPENSDELTPIQKRILKELKALQDLETLDSTKDAESRKKSEKTSIGKTPFPRLMKEHELKYC